MLFKLWGGNISSRTPGDPANMFSYTGPPGIKVGGGSHYAKDAAAAAVAGCTCAVAVYVMVHAALSCAGCCRPEPRIVSQ